MTAAELDELLYDFIANGVLVTASGDIEIAGGLGAKFRAALRAPCLKRQRSRTTRLTATAPSMARTMNRFGTQWSQRPSRALEASDAG